ncbi:MAG TPA: hypothetical protein VK469_22705, partial [Candidatus Kapabacteria bacterium]|nr:hypothetical protein [Candidatus Kapabacteria bacterium]
MTKNKKDAGKHTNSKNKGGDNVYSNNDKSISAYPIRKIMTPVKRGTVSRLAIKKAVKEVIAGRCHPNAS